MDNYNYVMVTRTAGIGDLMMIEPAIEALYYTYAPCRIILRTWEPFDWVLRGHPLIWKTIWDGYRCTEFGFETSGTRVTDLNGTLDHPVPVHHFNLHDAIEALNQMHGVDAFAAAANVRLLRRTPSFGHFDFTPNHQTVIQLRTVGMKSQCDDRTLTTDDLPMHLLGDATFIHPRTSWDDEMNREEFKRLIGGADMFIGSDSCGLHMAHAAGVRKVIGLYSKAFPAELRAYPGMWVARSKDELAWMVESAQRDPKYPPLLNSGNGADFIKGTALQFCKGLGLDVGSSEWPLPGAFPMPTENDRHLFDRGPFDYIFSSHCLEHIDNWQDELHLWEQSLRPGGTLFLYLPHPRMEMWTPGGPWVGHHHRWAPEPVSLVRWLNENTKFKVESYTCHPDVYWSFYIAARKVS